MKSAAYKFKDVDLAIDFRSLPQHDQEYLRTMFYETILSRSVKHSGKSFKEYYPFADNFTVFSNLGDMVDTMLEFSNPYANTASHLLNGKKFYMAWTYDA